MQFFSKNNRASASLHIVSCIYTATVILALWGTGYIYNVDFYKSMYLQCFLLACECLKYLAFPLQSPKDVKKQEHKKFRLVHLFRASFTILSGIVCFYAVAVLFGVPLLVSQRETVAFAVVMTIFTVLPGCLYLGSDRSIALLLSLTTPLGEVQEKEFSIINRVTCLGAWLGAIVMPLDWNEPYQKWPIPNIVGALFGYLIGNAVAATSCLAKSKKPTRISI